MSDAATREDAPAPAAAGSHDFERFYDLALPVTAVLGSGHISVRECLGLRKGSVVPLDQIAGDELGLYVNGVLIARGEVVIAGDRSAIRVSAFVKVERRE